MKTNNHPEYRVITVENDKKTTIEYFYADDDVKAYQYILAFRKKNKSNAYYWDRANGFVDHNGKHYDDIDDMFSLMHTTTADKKHKDTKDKYTYEVTVNIKCNDKDIKSKTFKKIFNVNHYKNLKQDMMNGFNDFKFLVENYDYRSCSTHNRSEYWSIDSHIMNDILFNIERLKKNKIGCPVTYCDKAHKLISAESPNLDKNELDTKTSNLAMKLWDDELDELARYIKLYYFYESYGIDYADEFPNEKIPILKGSYDCIDYKLTHKIMQKHWHLWIAKFEEIGQGMWD